MISCITGAPRSLGLGSAANVWPANQPGWHTHTVKFAVADFVQAFITAVSDAEQKKEDTKCGNAECGTLKQDFVYQCECIYVLTNVACAIPRIRMGVVERR